jgi:hypothetical protein
MWCEVEREVNKQPHNTLASLKAMIPDVMTNLDREVVIHVCKKFRSWIEADMEATGNSIKKMCNLYEYKLFLKFSSKSIHPNYFFYCFECCHRVCPNLSSAPCTYLVPHSLVEGCLLRAGLNLDENAVSDSQVRIQLIQAHL